MKKSALLSALLFLLSSSENGFGNLLPQGTLRLYSRDAQGPQSFLGEDAISHTPKNEDLKIRVGEAFEVRAERRQTDFRQITSNSTESEYEIKLKNKKAEDVEVIVSENTVRYRVKAGF